MPVFSPDGSMLYFSAPVPGEVSGGVSFFDRLLGIQVAMAHNVPSDWWRVPRAGGAVEQLTQLGETGLYGDFSPDGRHMAFVSSSGIYVMNPDGSDLEILVAGEGFFGSLDWVP